VQLSSAPILSDATNDRLQAVCTPSVSQGYLKGGVDALFVSAFARLQAQYQGTMVDVHMMHPPLQS
jgi:hypothetical protein